jgi:hypothetical protein
MVKNYTGADRKWCEIACTLQEKLLVYLEYLGTGEEGWLSSKGNGISKTTFVNVVNNVTDALFTHFVPRYIRLPTRQQARREAREFHRISGFPAIGYMAIDGTHIGVVPPRAHRMAYRNREP